MSSDSTDDPEVTDVVKLIRERLEREDKARRSGKPSAHPAYDPATRYPAGATLLPEATMEHVKDSLADMIAYLRRPLEPPALAASGNIVPMLRPRPVRQGPPPPPGTSHPHWGSPVEMLKEVIRDIEAGTIKPEGLFVGMTWDDEHGANFPYYASGMNRLELMGMLMTYVGVLNE